MTKIKDKKIKKLLLIVILFSILLIRNVFATASEYPSEINSSDDLWKIEDITSSDTLIGEKGTITTEGKTTTITYSGKSFRLLEGTGKCALPSSVSDPNCKGETGDRPYGYSWIRFKVAPLNDDGSEKNDGILNIKLPNLSEISTTTKDEKRKPIFTDYVGISKDKLNEALKDNRNLVFTYNFEYKSDTTNEEDKTHTLKIQVDPATTLLYKVGSVGTNPKDIEYNGPEEKKKQDTLRTSKIDNSPKALEKQNKISINSIVIIIVIIFSVGIILYLIKKFNKNL